MILLLKLHKTYLKLDITMNWKKSSPLLIHFHNVHMNQTWKISNLGQKRASERTLNTSILWAFILPSSRVRVWRNESGKYRIEFGITPLVHTWYVRSFACMWNVINGTFHFRILRCWMIPCNLIEE